MKKLSFVVLSALALLAITSCSREKDGKPNTLTIGTNAEFAPFSFIENQTIQGFDIDVAREVCRRIGVDLNLKDLPFEALVPGLQMGSLDLVAAGMSITEERAQVVDFSTAYVDAEPLCAVYYEGLTTVNSVQDLQKLRVAVNEGYTAEHYVVDQLAIEPMRLANPIEAMLALDSGRVDTFVAARNTLHPLIKGKLGLKVFEIPDTGDNCALMFPKGSTDLQERVNAAIADMLHDGTVHNFKLKWGLA